MQSKLTFTHKQFVEDFKDALAIYLTVKETDFTGKLWEWSYKAPSNEYEQFFGPTCEKKELSLQEKVKKEVIFGWRGKLLFMPDQYKNAQVTHVNLNVYDTIFPLFESIPIERPNHVPSPDEEQNTKEVISSLMKDVEGIVESFNYKMHSTPSLSKEDLYF